MALCDAALNPALFPPHQLRLDALRRFLSAYSARFRVHFGEEAREMADSSRLECTSFLSDFIRFPSRLRERRWRSCHVSYLRWDSIFQFSNMSQFLITYQFHFTLFRHPAGAGWTRVPSRMCLSLPSAYRCYLISSSSATLYELCCWSFVRQLRCRMRADLRVTSYKPSGELKMMRVSATETKTEYLSSTKVNKCRDCHLFCCRMQSLLNVKSRLNFRVCKHSLQIHLFYNFNLPTEQRSFWCRCWVSNTSWHRFDRARTIPTKQRTRVSAHKRNAKMKSTCQNDNSRLYSLSSQLCLHSQHRFRLV